MGYPYSNIPIAIIELGDAHGTIKSKIKPAERHSELAVNLAGTMAIFIFKTYQEKFGAKK
jgi:hypothetical protein